MKKIITNLEPYIEKGAIFLKPVKEKTLDALLKASPKECFELNDEDKSWIDASPIGKEFI